MKKMICGVLITMIGFGFAIISIVYMLMNNMGLPNFFGSLVLTGTLWVLAISIAVMLVGLGICLRVAYKGVTGGDHDEKEN